VSQPAGPVAADHRWIDRPEDLEDLLDELADEPAYALDTEFHRERTYHAKLALLQVGWAGGIALVDPLAVDVAPLARLLDGPGTCVMHASSQDLEILLRVCGTLPEDLFDTQVAAGFAGYSGVGLAALVAAELGVSLPKGDRLTDWLARPLPADAATYAANDVVHLLELHRRLVADLEARGRLQWARDECALLRERYAQPPDPTTVWWRIKEARSLRGRSAGVAQSLAAWREAKAREVDRPVRTVMADLPMVSMAQRPPRSEADLARVRGLDERYRRGKGAAELLAVVAEGLALAPSEVNLPPTEGIDRSRRAAAQIVSSWVSQRARDLGLDPTIVATRADVESILERGTGRLAVGWRAEVVGEPIRLLAEGKASVALDADGRLVLEERSGVAL
jgi:ribonuclease D